MDRLFHSSVELTYEHQQGRRFVASRVVDRGEFWWDPKRPDDRSLWDSKIRLGEDFFNEVINRPVPLDMNTLAALKRSALGLDFYLWLVYRTFALRAPLRLSWPTLYKYIRIDLQEVRALRSDATRLIHQRLCGWIDPGQGGRVGLDALCGYVWPDDAPTKRALRWRRAAVRRSLRELQGFERPWTVAEHDRGKFAIQRPGRPQVEVITGEIE